ncbi:MAG: tyrosine--tRNA ligase [Phycisphaerae bacterium]
MNKNITEQLELLKRGVEAIFSEQELTAKLTKSTETNKPLRVKLGMDPTAPDIHLGHSVVLRKLRQFQDLGHKAVLIIGDFTARIGDPSGRSKTRPVLSDDQIRQNAQTYFQQAGKILLTDPDHLEIRYNGSWLGEMKFSDVLKLASKMTVGQMLKREDFRNRFEQEIPISVHELLYPLMQGYDSVVIESDVELGGTDQTFNNLVGRDLQIDSNQPPQVVMIVPILAGTDGVNKMSKSLGNYIGLNDEPKLMFERVMSIPDKLMLSYFTLLTNIEKEAIAQLADPSKTHPKQAKMTLGKEIVKLYHSSESAEWSAEEFQRVHAEHQLPEELPQVKISSTGPQLLAKLLAEIKLVPSNAEGKRMIQQGGVKVDGQPITDPNFQITPASGMVVQVGRRKFAKLVVE